ncbi:MAG: Beta-glucosidase A [Phycisphaerae bacterium]|nr:Beta-glucosidase A [Phycisphaerae bacterium]
MTDSYSYQSNAVPPQRAPALPAGDYEFFWGAATAAYQIEGAAREDRKGPSIWDEFCGIPGNTLDGDTGEMACDHYHRWRADVELMRELSLRAYRFSVSWPRVMPRGRGPVNPTGLDFYDRLVDTLLRAGIEPFVTLYHWDLPAALQSELNGWLNPDMPAIFADYAAVVVERLGDRVAHWMTLNEPWVVATAGYFEGVHPPGLRDRAAGYRAGHNLLRAHAYAVAGYRASRCGTGQISFALNSSFSFPASDSPEDAAAAQRAVENFAGWFGDPCWFGDYPAVMRERLGDLLPAFSAEDAALLRRSMDFIALNYYTSDIVRHAAGAGPMDAEVVTPPDFRRTEMNWPIMPDGFRELLCWLSRRYGGLPVYVTENGAACPDQPDEHGYVDDQDRIAYLRSHLSAVGAAMAAGVNVRGYFVWSLMDNLEWCEGFSKRFGIVRCEPGTLRRIIKSSGRWYAKLIQSARRGAVALAAGAVP